MDCRRRYRRLASPGRQLVAVIAAAALVVTGCTSTTDGAASSTDEPSITTDGANQDAPPLDGADDGSTTYLGPIPAAAPLTPLTEISFPEYPEPPADDADDAEFEEYERLLDEYEIAMADGSLSASAFYHDVEALAEQTRSGGEAALAAWQTLLVAAGIAVGLGDNAVEVSGMTGSGLPMPLEEIRLQAELGTSSARLPLTQLADILDGAGFPISPEELAISLDEAEDEAFVAVLLALDPDGDTFYDESTEDYLPKATEDVSFTAAQVSVILRRLAVEVAMSSPEAAELESSPPGLRAQRQPAVTMPKVLDDLCDADEAWWRSQLRKDAQWAEGKLLDQLMQEQDASSQHTMRKIKTAQAIAGILAVLAKLLLVEADFALQSEPLVRTKSKRPGERQDVTVTLSLPSSLLDDVHNCILKTLATAGVDFREFTGPVKGSDLNFILTGDRLQYARGSAGTGAFRQQTDKQGRANFPVEGKAQEESLPDGAKPREVTSGVRLDANLKGTDMWQDLRSAFNARRDGPFAMVASALERFQLLHFTWDIPVRDWSIEAEFDMTLRGDVSANQMSNIFIPGLYACEDTFISESNGAAGTITSTPHRVTADYLSTIIDGEEASMLLFRTKGRSIDELVTHENGTELTYPEFTYDLELFPGRADGSPPQLYTSEHGSGCGDGIGQVSNEPMDCAPRTFRGSSTVTMLSDFLYVTVDHLVGKGWENCKLPLAPTVSDVVSPPQRLEYCPDAHLDGGEIPDVDTVFGDTNLFEITGQLSCSRESLGSVQRLDFDWTLEFCRIVDDKRAC